MTKELNKIYSEPHLGSKSFDMTFPSKGLSWAENIYQKLGKLCSDSDVIQVPCKYMDAVGEKFRKMLDEVSSDLLDHSDGCVDESVSSLKHNIISEDCKKSRVELDENASDGKLTTCVEVESIVSSVEDLSQVASVDVAQDVSPQNTRCEYSIKFSSTKATGSNFPDGAGEDNTNMESIVSSAGDPSLVTQFDVAQDLSLENTCDECSLKISVGDSESKFSDGAGENYKNIKPTVYYVENLCPVSSLVAEDLCHQNECEDEIKSISTEGTGSKISDGAGEDYKNLESVVSFVRDLISTGDTGSKFSDDVREDYKNMESIVSSAGDLSLVTSCDGSQDLNPQNTCDKYSLQSISTEVKGSKFSNGTKENYRNVSNLVAPLADTTSSLGSDDELCPFESQPNELMEGGSMLSGFTSSTVVRGTCIYQDTMSLLQSLENETGQQIESNKLEAPVQVPEFDISDGNDKEGAFKSPDVFHLNMEPMEKFEDVNPDDGWDDAECELAIKSYNACKNVSYKRKLRRAFLSKILPSKSRMKAEHLDQVIDMGMQNTHRIDASSFSRERFPEKPSTQDSSESDWVLL